MPSKGQLRLSLAWRYGICGRKVEKLTSMKAKLVLTVVMMALCVSGYAQDIIHTFDGKSIEAKILEISDDDILYKTFDNQEGPDYRMSVNKVARIVFANGTEKVFAPADIFRSAPVAPGYGNPNFGPYGPIVYRHGRFYDGYGRIYDDEFRDYLGVSLYGSDYLKARNQITSGCLLTFAGGAAVSFSLIASLIISDFNKGDNPFGKTSQTGPIIGGLVGVACLAGGIPLWIKGARKMHAFADDYNQRYGAGKTNLSLGSAPSGLGLTLNF